jgi:SAM-dependent methyltransferase
MPIADRTIRRLVPAIPALSRVKVLMWPLNAIDRVLSFPYRELRGLPPNHMRIRVGVGNRLLFNATQYRLLPVNFWLDALALGHVSLSSNIVDLGCGCGRFAMALRDFWFHDRTFTGAYFGVDVDDEMLAWCRSHFPADRFTFHKVEVYSRTYNPRGESAPTSSASSPSAHDTPGGTHAHPSHAAHPEITPGVISLFGLPLPSASQDFLFANSLFSHLLEGEFTAYVRESARVLRPGGWMHFSTFCLEHVDRSPGSRWSFQHREGAAHVEDRRYPEAAVAYELAWLREQCLAAGFASFESLPSTTQTMIRCRR